MIYGPRAERTARLLDQLELQLEEAEATEDQLAAEQAQRRSTLVRSFERQWPSRKPFPEHLPREWVVIPAPETARAAARPDCRRGQVTTRARSSWS